MRNMSDKLYSPLERRVLGVCVSITCSRAVPVLSSLAAEDRLGLVIFDVLSLLSR